jgi:hypothetical protein
VIPSLLASAQSVCAPGRVSAQNLAPGPEAEPTYNRFHEFLDDTFRSTFWWVEVGGAVAIDQAASEPPEWSGGSGTAKRVGSDFGKLLSSEAIESGAGAVFNQRVAYDRCRCSGGGPRLGHALSRVFVGVDSSDGHLVPKFPLWIAIAGSSALASTWSPPSYNAHHVVTSSLVAFGAAAGIKVLKEFIHVN